MSTSQTHEVISRANCSINWSMSRRHPSEAKQRPSHFSIWTPPPPTFGWFDHIRCPKTIRRLPVPPRLRYIPSFACRLENVLSPKLVQTKDHLSNTMYIWNMCSKCQLEKQRSAGDGILHIETVKGTEAEQNLTHELLWEEVRYVQTGNWKMSLLVSLMGLLSERECNPWL